RQPTRPEGLRLDQHVDRVDAAVPVHVEVRNVPRPALRPERLCNDELVGGVDLIVVVEGGGLLSVVADVAVSVRIQRVAAIVEELDAIVEMVTISVWPGW